VVQVHRKIDKLTIALVAKAADSKAISFYSYTVTLIVKKIDPRATPNAFQ
jgi:hypothetical protein